MSQPLNDPAKRARIAQILSEYEARQRSEGHGLDDLGRHESARPESLTVLSEEQDTMVRLCELLPNAEALHGIARLRARLDLEILDIKDDIADLQDELRDEQDPESMDIIQGHIAELISQIHHIRHSSSEAESIVKSITTDIQRLDTAKRNLVESLKVVKRWGMLTQAYAELIELLDGGGRKDYKGISNLMAAITALLDPMRPLTANRQVAQMFTEVQGVQAKVKESVSEDLDTFLMQDPNKPADLEVVKEACLVVDVLGADYRNHIIERYANTELRDYRRIFSATGEAGQLDNTARRFAWFRRLLKTYDDEHSVIFPPSWHIDRLLVAKFTEATKMDLAAAIGKEKPTVNVLLEAWQACIDWESQMARRFDMSFKDISKVFSDMGLSGVVGVSIAGVFDSHAKIFVEAQDRAIEDMLSAYRGPRSRSSLEGVSAGESETPQPILPSSTELYYFYGQTLDQLAKYTTGAGMMDLVAVFAKWLKIYSEEVLVASMKKPEPRRSMDTRANLQEVRNACLTLNTADYCLTTNLQLEERLISIIDDRYKASVTFEKERQYFLAVISASLTVLLRELEIACEPAFAAILKTPWMNMENVSGRSAYVVDLVASTKGVAEVVRERIEQKKYVRSFADKAVGVIIARFTASVIKSRPLRKIGAEQILLDVQAVKACLLDIPDPHADKSTSTTFTKLVLKLTGQLETMLKVVLAPEDPPEGFVQNYCLLIGDKSFNNFQKILDLKGTPRADQQRLLEIFLSVSSSMDDLSDSSFLTGLDMDTDATTKPGSGTGNSALLDRAGLMSPSSASLPALLRGGSVDHSRMGTPARGQDAASTFGDLKRLVSFAMRDM